jgi:branched-chain amino acid transport system ATP-binding protein
MVTEALAPGKSDEARGAPPRHLLEVFDAKVSYGPISAVRGVSFDVVASTCCGIVGANGAGKTSLLSAIVGLLPLKGGRVFFDGEEVTGKHPEDMVTRGLALVPERRQVFASMSVQDNLFLGAYSRHRSDTFQPILEKVYDLFPILYVRRRQRAGTLSGGEQQMLAIGRGLMSNPRLLMVDEPSLGLAPIVTDAVGDALARLREEGMTILLVEQNIRLAMDLADKLLVMEQGDFVQQEDGRSGITQHDIAAAYLGG